MKKRVGIIILVLLLLILAGGGAAFYYYYSKYINIDAIYPGVTIQGMSVGGMTQEEADLILENENDVQADNYGIYNIRGRLRIFSENRCHMRVISRPGIGTCVCIEITKRKEK